MVHLFSDKEWKEDTMEKWIIPNVQSLQKRKNK